MRIWGGIVEKLGAGVTRSVLRGNGRGLQARVDAAARTASYSARFCPLEQMHSMPAWLREASARVAEVQQQGMRVCGSGAQWR